MVKTSVRMSVKRPRISPIFYKMRIDSALNDDQEEQCEIECWVILQTLVFEVKVKMILNLQDDLISSSTWEIEG